MNHETIKSPEQGLAVLENISGIWQAPTAGEVRLSRNLSLQSKAESLRQGFHRIVALPSDLPLKYSFSDIDRILDLVEASPTLPASLPPPPDPTPRGAFFAGRGRGVSARVEHSPASRNLMSSWLAQPARGPSSGSRGGTWSRGRPAPYSPPRGGWGRGQVLGSRAGTDTFPIDLSQEDTT